MNNTQVEYWNSVSETKEFNSDLNIETFKNLVSEDGLILDIGCGYGRTLEDLYQNGYTHLTGIDFSEGMIRRGKGLYPYLDLRTGDAGNMKYPSEHFDAVILNAILTCIVKDEEQKRLVSELKRILKPSGTVYINDFLLNRDERNLSRYKEYESKYGTYGVFELPEGAVLRHQSEEWIKELLSVFETIEYEKYVGVTMNGNASNRFRYIGKNV